MRVHDDLFVLKLKMDLGGAINELNLGLIVDPEKGAAIFDSGMPGSTDEILEQLASIGLGWDDLKHVLVTHHDIDHIGSLSALREVANVEIYADAGEVPYIEGDTPFQKAPTPERLAQIAGLAELFALWHPAKVDRVLHDGDHIDLAGGVTVIATPGHTSAHTSYYLERSKTLIAGDALVAQNGQLSGPREGATPDMVSAKASVKRLTEFDIDTIVCYHGGIVNEDANGQLRRVADGA